ncbi:cell division protein SepF [Spiroplasma endosymbiont of Lasioglossum malachurum]|uniref:cell division protein SepF n=1 Tax=Spiroplasma endosymbiont of Lasioglossum malachurum TaxID=3066319 RepID=UPI0030D3F266
MGWRSKKYKDNDKNSNYKTSFQEQIQEFAPKNYQEIESVANAMILQKPIKVNLTTTVENDRRRIIDFLCGISYVIGFVVDKTDIHIYEFKNELS